MAGNDLCICVGQTQLTRLAQSLSQVRDVRDGFLAYVEEVPVDQARVSVDWNVLKVPVFLLSPPSEAQWQGAIRADGTALPRQADCFVLQLPAVRLRSRAAPEPDRDMIKPIDLICTMRINGGALEFDVAGMAAAADYAALLYRDLFNRIVLPTLTASIEGFLDGIHLPAMSFPHLGFGAFALTVGDGRVALSAQLAGNAAPLAPPARGGDGLCVLLSPAAVQRVVDFTATTFARQKRSQSVRVSLGQNDLHAAGTVSTSIALEKVNARFDPAAPSRITAGAIASVSAAVDVDPRGAYHFQSGGSFTVYGIDILGGGGNPDYRKLSVVCDCTCETSLQIAADGAGGTLGLRVGGTFSCTVAPRGDPNAGPLFYVGVSLASAVKSALTAQFNDIIAGFAPVAIVSFAPRALTLKGLEKPVTVTPGNPSASAAAGMFRIDCAFDIPTGRPAPADPTIVPGSDEHPMPRRR